MKKAAMILAPGFEESEAIIPADLLRRAGVDLILAGLEGISVTGAHDIVVEADMTIHELPENLDGIILPGGMPGSAILADSPEVLDLVRNCHNNSILVAAICAAPALVLSRAGVLEGRRFTCYPGMEKEVSEAEYLDEPVVMDSNLITSQGVGTAGLFGLSLVEYLVDKATASKLGKATLIL